MKQRLGVMCLSARGLVDYTLALTKGLLAHFDISLYLSESNFRLEQFRGLNARVRTYRTYRTVAELIFGIIHGNTIRTIARDISSDHCGLLLDTGASYWSPYIKRRLRRIQPQITRFEVIHDVDPHPDRWEFLTRAGRIIAPTETDVLIGASANAAQLLRIKHKGIPVILSKLGGFHASAGCDELQRLANRSRFLFFGRIESYKGIGVLLAAFERVASRIPATLTIAGNGPLTSADKDKAQLLGVSVLNHWLSESEIAQLMESHGVMVIPYTSATQSAVAMTALANNMPCIASRIGALPEQIVDGETGLLVTPGDVDSLAEAMQRIATDEALAKSLIQGIGRAAHLYSWDAIGKALSEDMLALASSGAA